MTKDNKKEQAIDNYYKPFPKRLRELLDRKGETQAQLAKYLGVKRQTVGYWKDGITSPDVDAINGIADYYNVSTDYLLGRSDIPSLNLDDRAIYEQTGLSEDAIEILRFHHSTDKENTFTKTVKLLLIKNKLLHLIRFYLWYEVSQMDWQTEDGDPLLPLTFISRDKTKQSTAAEPDSYTEILEKEDINRILLIRIQEEIEQLRKEIEE